MQSDLVKADPSHYLLCFQEYLNDLRIKSVIPIPYETAKQEVYLRMSQMFKTKVEQDLFEQLVKNFHEITDVQKWYEDRTN